MRSSFRKLKNGKLRDSLNFGIVNGVRNRRYIIAVTIQ